MSIIGYRIGSSVPQIEKNSESGVINAISTTEAERHDTLARLQAEIESLKLQLSDAVARIESLSAEKVALVTRIASALEYDIAEIFSSKDDPLKVAQSTIAVLEARIDGCDDSSSSTAAIGSTTINIPRNVSLEERGHLPIITTMSGEESVQSNEVSISPRRRDTNILRTKSAMIKSRNSSSSSSIGIGRVSFDRDTSFDRSSRLPKFDLFASPAHSKENFGTGKEKPIKSSFGGDGDEAGCSPSSTQTWDGNSCEGSIGGRRRRKYRSGRGRSGGKLKKVSLDCFDNDRSFLCWIL